MNPAAAPAPLSTIACQPILASAGSTAGTSATRRSPGNVSRRTATFMAVDRAERRRVANQATLGRGRAAWREAAIVAQFAGRQKWPAPREIGRKIGLRRRASARRGPSLAGKRRTRRLGRGVVDDRRRVERVARRSTTCGGVALVAGDPLAAGRSTITPATPASSPVENFMPSSQHVNFDALRRRRRPR